MGRSVRLTAMVIVAGTLLVAKTARADVDALTTNGWKLRVSGFVGGYLQTGFCDHSDKVVAGGAACNTGPGGEERTAVSNGLGVGHFGASVSTVKNDWELGGTAEIWSGLNSLPAKVGFGEAGPSLRQ